MFVHWLIFQSLYRIHALCPYCMVVWAVTIPIFWYVTLHNLNQFGRRLPPIVQRGAALATSYHAVVLTAWAVLVLGLIAEQFWSYWKTLP